MPLTMGSTTIKDERSPEEKKRRCIVSRNVVGSGKQAREKECEDKDKDKDTDRRKEREKGVSGNDMRLGRRYICARELTKFPSQSAPLPPPSWK